MSVSTASRALANRLARMFGYVPARDQSAEQYATRSGFYAINDALYHGTVYSVRANAGYLEDVLETYIGEGYCNVNRYPIFPFFMPFKEIVETYQNVLPGTWGKEIRPAAVKEGEQLSLTLTEPLARVWKDSLLDTAKQRYIRWGANFGTVGLRISAQPAEGNTPARATISVDHPSMLFNFERDTRDNVTAVVLKYAKLVNYGTLTEPDMQSVEVVEEITKDDFSRTYDGKEQLKDDERANRLGFCPYVIQPHKDNGTPYGDWAYKGSESVVHRINWRISRQDKSIDRHQFPKWFGAGGGTKPTTVDMGDTALTWAELRADTPTPFLQAIVGDIDQKAAQDFWMALRDELRGRQPELNLNDVKLLGNTSGEALAQILKPTESAVLEVRPGYHHGLIRAKQMAASAGHIVGAWDLGTGEGQAGADAAFRDGDLDFTFEEMPAIPETPQQKITNANAAVADRKAKFELAGVAKRVGTSDREALRVAGYSDAEIEAMEEEIAEQDELPDGEEEDE